MSNSNNVKTWRVRLKSKMVSSMGGKCQSCGYDKCHAALHFHHLDPEEKEFNFGGTMSNPKKWEIVEKELKKCILLCSNCHAEIHSGIKEIPQNFQRYDPSLMDAPEYDVKERKNKFGTVTEKFSKEVLEDLVKNKSIHEISKEYHLHSRRIKLWCKNYNITIPEKGYWEKRKAGYSHEESLKILTIKSFKFKGILDKELALKAYGEIQNGSSLAYTARNYGLTKAALKNALVKYEIDESFSNLPCKLSELKELVKTLPMTKIGEKFGVSDNGVKKWCIKFGIEYK